MSGNPTDQELGSALVLTSVSPAPQGEDINLDHEHETMKHRIVHFLQKYLFNPPIKFLFAIGLVPPGYGLLETTGRKTGKSRLPPWATDSLVGSLDRGGARQESWVRSQYRG